MIAKLLPLLVLIVVFSGETESRTLTMYDLRPAMPIRRPEFHTLKAMKTELTTDPIFKDCSKPDDKFKVTDVKVEGCTAPPCKLKLGSTAQVEIDFTAEEVTSNITAKVYGEIAGIKVPFSISDPNGCHAGITCPTGVGKSYAYKYSLSISSAYPAIQVPVLWYLMGLENVEQLCISVLVQLEKS